jgi:hypothetical protein
MAGCYSASLDDENFICAPTGKRCPDDYVCDKKKNRCVAPELVPVDASVEKTPTDATAEPTKEGPVIIDGAVVKEAPADCLDKANEPNNSAETADPTLPIKPGTNELQDWEICYPGDVDTFKLELVADQKISLTVKFVHTEEGDLEAALVNPKGFVIQSSRSETDDEQISIPKVTTPGTYYLAVYGFGDAVNRYDLVIDVE